MAFSAVVHPVAYSRGQSSNFDLGKSQHSAEGCRRDSNLLLVTLLDGDLLALDPDAGTISWTLDLGSPLLSSSGIWFENSPENEDPVSRSILPGADGSLYIFTDASGASQVQVVHGILLQDFPITAFKFHVFHLCVTAFCCMLLYWLLASTLVYEYTEPQSIPRATKHGFTQCMHLCRGCQLPLRSWLKPALLPLMMVLCSWEATALVSL